MTTYCGIYDALEYIAGILTADSAIETFCQTKFGKSLRVFIGQEETELPSVEELPAVIMIAGGRSLEGGDNIKARSAKITKAIFYDAENDTANLITTVSGVKILDEFSDLIDKTIVNAPIPASGAYSFQVVDGPNDHIKKPVYSAFSGLSVQIDSNF